jgi:hypothetical protein
MEGRPISKARVYSIRLCCGTIFAKAVYPVRFFNYLGTYAGSPNAISSQPSNPAQIPLQPPGPTPHSRIA